MPAIKFPELYEKLMKDYGLTRHEHFWLHEKSGRWIINHNAIRLIMRKENIRTFTMKLSEETKGEHIHILTGAIGFTQGDTVYEAIATTDSILILNSDNGEEYLGDCIARIKFKAGDAVAELGEGDNSNFREGYKTIIVLKRAEDRAAMELIQAKYQYGLVDEQDAMIIEGQSEVHGQAVKVPEQKKPEKTPAETSEDEATAIFNQLHREVKKWIGSVGVESAKQMLKSSDGIEKLSQDQQGKLGELLINASKIQGDIDREKAKALEQKSPAKEEKLPETKKLNFRDPTEEELVDSTPEDLAWVNEQGIIMQGISTQLKFSTFAAQCVDRAKKLPDGLRSYYRAIATEKRSELARSK